MISGDGGPAGRRRAALAGVGACTAFPPPPKAETSSTTSATTAIASNTARRRRRRSRSRCRRCLRAGRRSGTGGDMAGTVADETSGFNRVNAQGSSARDPVNESLQSQSGGRIGTTRAVASTR